MSASMTDDDLLAKFDAPASVDPKDVPKPILEAMQYMDSKGLTGDYHDGQVSLAGTDTIQWYPRSRMFSSHDDVLQWVQLEDNGLMLGQVGTRPHPNKTTTDEDGDEVAATGGYVEIMEESRWGGKR